MAIVEISTNAIADIFAGEMALARTGVDRGRAHAEQLRMVILSIADRFAQAPPLNERRGLDLEQFDRSKFYARCGLRASGELLP